MAGSQQDVDSSFKTYLGASNKVSSLADLNGTAGKIENIIATFIGCLDDITNIDGWLASNGACRLQTKVNSVADANYAITTADNYNEIWSAPSTANRTVTLPDPTNSLNDYRKIIVKNKGDGTYRVTVNPYNTETINVMSGNDEWTLSSFELVQSGDWAEFISDGTNWIKINAPYLHPVDDPGPGWLDSSTSWTSDSFTSGKEVTYPLPIGSIASQSIVLLAANASDIYWRKSGDTNISNTPSSSTEYAQLVIASQIGAKSIMMANSSDLKIQFASTATNANVYFSYPTAYLQ